MKSRVTKEVSGSGGGGGRGRRSRTDQCCWFVSRIAIRREWFFLSALFGDVQQSRRGLVPRVSCVDSPSPICTPKRGWGLPTVHLEADFPAPSFLGEVPDRDDSGARGGGAVRSR